MTPRLLRVRCARWDQVDAFLHKKLRPDGRLSMKVPFVAEPGAPVTLAIELPNQIVVALDGVVGAPAQRDRPDAAVVVLAGAKAAIDRLSAMVADARVGGGDGDLSATLAAREAELRRLRQQAAHEVLGCSRGPTLEELRAAWRQRVRREHPDAVARFRSAALRLTAEETMIHVTRAYERLRATVCADHRAVIAGTSVRTIGSLAIESQAGDGFDVVPLTPPVDDSVEALGPAGPLGAAGAVSTIGAASGVAGAGSLAAGVQAAAVALGHRLVGLAQALPAQRNALRRLMEPLTAPEARLSDGNATTRCASNTVT